MSNVTKNVDSLATLNVLHYFDNSKLLF